MNWNQPICAECYAKRYPNRKPARLMHERPETEMCCACGIDTNDGIYFRVDPRTVDHPKP